MRRCKMTKQEYTELFDLINCGHDAELDIDNCRYFLEWSEDGIDVFQMNNSTGVKITTIQGDDKITIVNKLFELPFVKNKSLNTSYCDIEIIDIE